MSLPVINVLNGVLTTYLQGEYPELSHVELDTVARDALANLNTNKEFQELYYEVIASTLQAYVATHVIEEPEPDEDEVVAFKKKAKELGLKVSPIAPKVYLFNCVCGAPHTKIYCTYDATLRGKVMRCHNCGLEGPPRKYQYQAKKAWNDMITEKIINNRKGDDSSGEGQV